MTDFIVKCKDEEKVFRGYKYNTFMYEVCKVCEEDEDFYVWRMELENGRQYDGNFQIYVYPPGIDVILLNFRGVGMFACSC